MLFSIILKFILSKSFNEINFEPMEAQIKNVIIDKRISLFRFL